MIPFRCLLLLSLPLAAQNPFAGNATEAETGRGLFRIRCAPCHGIAAKGGRGPDLTLGTFSAGNIDKDLFRVISFGVTGTEMPPYGFVGDENIWRLVAYIRSVSTPQQQVVNGNPTNGESVFWKKGGCGNCHRVGMRGGPMGPDLTRVGRKRSLPYLRQSILNPNADLTPGFYKITVVTSDGRKITGVQKGFDNFSAQLITTDGRILSYQRSAITSAEREYVSMMPVYKNFNESELNDLIAYLVSLRGEQQ